MPAKRLRVFRCTDFEGVQPTGVAAIVVAYSEEDARALLRPKTPTRDNSFTLQEIHLDRPQVLILANGDY